MGEVAYRLDLPATSKVHPIFHVSLLREVLKPMHQVLSRLPTPDNALKILEQVLQRHVLGRGDKKVIQVLIQWTGNSADLATRGRF